MATKAFILVSVAAIQAYASDGITTAKPLSPPEEEFRYELIQNPLGGRSTFRLDRFTGDVWNLVIVNDQLLWQPSAVFHKPTVMNPVKPRFKIILSKESLPYIFLLDFPTGRTWLFHTLENSPKDRPISYWEEIPVKAEPKP